MDENMKISYINDLNNDTLENKPKLADFVRGFKFRYRGKPKRWMVGDGETMTIIEHDISLLEDELQLGYIDHITENALNR